MRRLLRRISPDAEILAATAEQIPLEASSVDVIFVAEAFHLFGSPTQITSELLGAESRNRLQDPVVWATNDDRCPQPWIEVPGERIMPFLITKIERNRFATAA